MKTPLSPALGLALCLLLSSCVIESQNPLSSPNTAPVDKRLLGDWFEKKDQDTFHFSIKKEHWMHVVITSKQNGFAKKLGLADPKPEEHDFFPTVIGTNTFLNVQMIGKDDKGHPTKSYVFLRYSISPDHVLQMWMMNQDATAAAVRAGKLKGIVRQDKNPLMVGKPPHPDLDVTLQDTGESMVKFIQSTDAPALFSEKMEPLYQSKSAGK